MYLVVVKEESQAIYKHETLEAAKAAMHTELAYAYNTGIKVSCVIMDQTCHAVVLRETTFDVE